MKKLLIIICFTCLVSTVFSQEWPLKKMVQENFEDKPASESWSAFAFNKSSRDEKGAYDLLTLNTEFTAYVLFEKPETLEVTIPSGHGVVFTAQLVLADLGNIRFTQNKSQEITDVKKPVCYQGVIKNEGRKNAVMLTINEDFLSVNIVLPDSSLQIARRAEINANEYVLFNSNQRSGSLPVMNCGTIKEPSPAAMQAMQSAAAPSLVSGISDRCIYVFVDCFDSLYQWRGSNYQQTINFVYDLFNGVATGYLNEQIKVKISVINVWTTADPYRQDNRDNALADLAGYYQDNFWGNVCVGLDFSINLGDGGRSGVAGDIGRMKGDEPYSCPAYTVNDHPFCYNDMNYFGNYQNFPATSIATPEQVYLVMHELGHLFGSAHTQWCGWAIITTPVIVRGALDNCATVEPICSSTCTTNCATCPPCTAGPAPVNGGTIMSYCINTGEYVNFNNGFGTIPGNTIRSFLDGHACVVNCPSCLVNQTIGGLGTGVHRFEVSNIITANGTLSSGSYVSMDAGSRITLSPGFRANGGSRVRLFINGCGGIR